MAVGAPCVEGEHGAENTEAYECHREEECLPAMRDGAVAGDLEDVPCQLSALGSRVVIDADEAEHEECRAAHEHQGQLHGRVVLAARAPYADEKVHRDKSHLIEHKHGEEVDRDKEAEHTGRQQNQPQEESLGLSYGPRCERTGKYYYRRKQEHGHRYAVDTHGKVDVERLEPCPGINEEHRSVLSGFTEGQEIDQKIDRQGGKGEGADYSHRADLTDIPAQGKTAEHEQRNHHEVNQYVGKHLTLLFFC